MPARWSGREQRRAPRVDVRMRVKGHLVSLDTPIIIHDLSRTGFAVVSERMFDTGETLDFLLEGEHGGPFSVTARAVHSRPLLVPVGTYFTGFMFVPGALTGRVPQVLIDELIEALMPAGSVLY
jgi:hypothetical protein